MVFSSRPSLRSSSAREAGQRRPSTRTATSHDHNDKENRKSVSSAILTNPTTRVDKLNTTPGPDELHRTISTKRKAPSDPQPRRGRLRKHVEISSGVDAIVNGHSRRLDRGAIGESQTVQHEKVHEATTSQDTIANRVAPDAEEGERPGGESTAPRADQDAQDKRALRSKDGGSRLKSDLATYFSNYDDIITDAPKQPEVIAFDAPIIVVDDPLKVGKPELEGSKTTLPFSNHPRARARQSNSAHSSPVKPSNPRTNFPSIDFSTIARGATLDADDSDPLADNIYFLPHRRAERQEKQLRNIEKERAQHEKVQLERLLDGLQGSDWLRVMGITGVTDGERKDWQPKRNYFIREVRALVEKFRIWKEAEKRLKLEREAALLARQEEEDTDEDGSPVPEEAVGGADATPSSDLDACAARQLLLEADSATTVTKRIKPRKLHTSTFWMLPPEPESRKPFTSFYAKPHLRAAALGKQRHGRTITAFGHPVPNIAEAEFTLPDEYLTPEALRDHARQRRRVQRGTESSTRAGRRLRT